MGHLLHKIKICCLSFVPKAPPSGGLSPQATGGVPLSSIIPVDLHIIISQITAPCLGAGIAGTHVHLDKDIMLRQNFGGLVLAVGVVGGVLADIDLTGGTAQPDTDLVDGEIAGGVADGAEDAAPVGIAAKDSSLEQVGACLLYTSPSPRDTR